MSATNYLENAIINHIFRSTAYSAPGTIAVPLCLSDPGEAATTLAGGVECANSGSYARVAVGPGSGSWDAPAAGVTANTGAVTYATATGSWGTVTHAAISDSATWNGGNCLFYGALTASKSILSGDTPVFAIGEIDITLD